MNFNHLNIFFVFSCNSLRPWKLSSIYLHICGYLTCNAVLVILFNYFVIPTIISLSNSLIILKYNSQFSNIFVGYLIFNILWSNIMVFMISVIWNLLKIFLWLNMSPIIIYFWYMHERNFYLGAGLPLYMLHQIY